MHRWRPSAAWDVANFSISFFGTLAWVLGARRHGYPLDAIILGANREGLDCCCPKNRGPARKNRCKAGSNGQSRAPPCRASPFSGAVGWLEPPRLTLVLRVRIGSLLRFVLPLRLQSSCAFREQGRRLQEDLLAESLATERPPVPWGMTRLSLPRRGLSRPCTGGRTPPGRGRPAGRSRKTKGYRGGCRGACFHPYRRLGHVTWRDRPSPVEV